MSADQRPSVMQVEEALIATLPEHPTDSTINELQELILNRIARTDSEADGVVLDVGAVQTVDSFFARMIVETAKMVELMGAHPVLVGVSPAIAITVTELGLALGEVETALGTDQAIEKIRAFES